MSSQANHNSTRNRPTYQSQRQKLIDLIQTRIPKRSDGTPDFTQFTKLAMIMRDPIVPYFGIRDTDQLILKYNFLLDEIAAEQYAQGNVAGAPAYYPNNEAYARQLAGEGAAAAVPAYYNANANYARQLAEQNAANAAAARQLAEQNAALARQLAEQNNANAALARQLAEQNAAMARQLAEQNAVPGYGAEGGKKKRTVRRKTTKKKRSVKK